MLKYAPSANIKIEPQIKITCTNNKGCPNACETLYRKDFLYKIIIGIALIETSTFAIRSVRNLDSL